MATWNQNHHLLCLWHCQDNRCLSTNDGEDLWIPSLLLKQTYGPHPDLQKNQKPHAAWSALTLNCPRLGIFNAFSVTYIHLFIFNDDPSLNDPYFLLYSFNWSNTQIWIIRFQKLNTYMDTLVLVSFLHVIYLLITVTYDLTFSCFLYLRVPNIHSSSYTDSFNTICQLIRHYKPQKSYNVVSPHHKCECNFQPYEHYSSDLNLHIILVFVETTLDSINPLILLVKKHIVPLRVKNCTKHLANSLHIRKFYKRMEKRSQVLLLHLECHQWPSQDREMLWDQPSIHNQPKH